MNICTLRDLSLPWVAHTVPLDHMEAQGHMAPQDHQVPQEPLWGHTTLDHTTRDLQDHSAYSGTLIRSTLGQKSCGVAVDKLFHFFPQPVGPLRLTSHKVGAMATHTGNRDNLTQVSM